jgi:hypothetical protein
VHTHTVKRIDIMQAPAPDLLPDDRAPSPAGIEHVHRDEEMETRSEAAMLEQLADRVNAARSVY